MAKKSKINEDELLQKIAEKILSEHAIIQNERHIEREELHDAIGSTLQEFLSHFILLGYDFEGNPVNLTYAGCQRDADSLSTNLSRFVAAINNHNRSDF